MRICGILSTVVGSVLIGLSFLWPFLFPPESRWTPQQAEELARAGTTYHKLALGGHAEIKGHGHSHGKSVPAASKEEVDAARRRWEESKAALNAAQTASQNTARWLGYGGVLVVLLGVGAMLVDKKHSPKRAAA